MHEGIIRRFQELIDQSKALLPATAGAEWTAKYLKWELSCLNLLEKTFGKEDQYYKQLMSHRAIGNPKVKLSYGTACMESAKEEVGKGLLYKIEQLISADFFDSILEHAEYLVSKGHKDPAAILGRVVIEKTLKHIAERENIVLPEKVKLSKVNEILWKKGVYNKITWRLIQGYVDLGNFAAHGDFDEYNNSEVEDMLDWIRKNLVNL